MHAENIDRLRGRPGEESFERARRCFRYWAVTEGRYPARQHSNVVQLTREAIDSSRGDDVPVEWLVRNEAIAEGMEPVTIGEIVLPK